MRLTVHISDEMGKEVRRLAENEKESVSSVVAQSIEFFICERKRRQLGEKVLRFAGKTKVSPEALEQFHAGREDHDRS